MQSHFIVVIGASAGGLGGLLTIVAGLPPTLSAAVFVVLHTATNNFVTLAELLQSKCRLPVAYPGNNDPIRTGRIFLATPGKHLLLESDRIRLTDDPKENYVRPAIDVLFRSAARAFGKRVVGVVLSGNLRDGASGLREIKERGGMTLVQSPDEAEWPSMPLSAIAASRIDRVLPLAQIATEIVRYANLYDGSQGV